MRCDSPPESVVARAREIEIAEPDVGEEAQPRADLFEDLVRDLLFALG